MALKKILGFFGGILLLLVLALLFIYFTDNRYSLAVKSYSALKEASSMALTFRSDMGMGEGSLGIEGDTQIVLSPRSSLTEVRLSSEGLGNPKIADIYTRGENVYHKYNISFLPWQKGMPVLQEDAFNPAVLGNLSANLDLNVLVDVLRFMFVLDKEDDPRYPQYYTTDFFTIEEVKSILIEVLKLNPDDVRNWDIRAYAFRVVFDRESKVLDSLSLDFEHEVSGVAFENGFYLQFTGLDEVREIPVPEGLPE